MAIFPCKEFTPCFDPASPVQNFSAESSDGPEFIGLWFPFLPDNPIGGNDPKNPPTYQALGCVAICTSTISQQDADLCAQRQAFICAHTPPNAPPPTLFYSNLAVCNISCPDGSIFSYRVLPGAFVDVSQAAADEQAGAFACAVGSRALICLTNLPNGCLGNAYASTLQTTAQGNRSFTFTVTAGALPPGLTLTQTGPNLAIVAGTPTAAGNFAFTVRATESNGNFMERTYTIDILGITNSPPSATKGSAYAFTFTAAGGTAPYTYFLASGALPDGLSMDSAGNITGTPTTVQTSNFTVSVTDSS